MSRFNRSRAILTASAGAILMSLLSVVSVLANGTNGPFPK